MYIEAHDTSTSAPVDATASANLSAQIFSTPKDFLQIISKDFDKIAQSGSNSLSKVDLLEYAKHGKDPEGMAAAKIAAEHFEELQQIPAQASDKKTLSGSGISRADLILDTNIVSGDSLSQLIADSHKKHDNAVGALALVVGFGLTGAAANARTPILAIPMLAGAIGAGATIAMLVHQDNRAADRLIAETTKDSYMIRSWI